MGLEFKNESDKKEIKKAKYLKENVFYGLENLNDGFDVESILYFSELDFEIVLKRVKENGIGVNGIEPWFDNEYYDTIVAEEYNLSPTDEKWYLNAFNKFREEKKKLQYSASYFVPKQLLNE